MKNYTTKAYYGCIIEAYSNTMTLLIAIQSTLAVGRKLLNTNADMLHMAGVHG